MDNLINSADMRHKKSWFAAIGLAALIFPLGVFALTPEQSLDKAVKSLDTMTSYKMDIDMKLDLGERTIGKPGQSMQGQVVIKLGTRILDKRNGEGRLALEHVSVSGAENGESMSFAMHESIAVDWKVAGEKLYFRLAQIPQVASDYLKQQLEIDLAPIIGVWIGMDAPESIDDIGSAPVSTLSIPNELPQQVALQSAIRKLPVFRVLGIEKRMKNAAGEDLVRLRVRINPALINTVQQAEIKALPRDKYFREDLAALNKRYAELRKNLSKLFMVVNLNVTKNRVERMELGGSIEEPVESCAYDTRLKRSVCKTAKIRTYRFAVGINLAPAGIDAIQVPDIWKTLEEAQRLLMPKPEPQPEDNLTQVLTNPGP